MITQKPVALTYNDLQCETGPNGRYYTSPEGVRYPSVTTVLGSLSKEAIEEWRKRVGEEEADKISRTAAWRGTNVHEALEFYCGGMEPKDISVLRNPLIKNGFYKLKSAIDENLTEVYAQEVALYSDHLKLAGRCDMVGKWAGRRSIVDWKTSTSAKSYEHIHGYFMQGAFYAVAWEERTGQAVDQIVIGIACDDSQNAQIFIEPRDKWVKPLQEVVATWNRAND